MVTNGQPRPVRELLNRIVMAAGLEPPRLKVPYRVARAGGTVVERIWEQRGRARRSPDDGLPCRAARYGALV